GGGGGRGRWERAGGARQAWSCAATQRQHRLEVGRLDRDVTGSVNVVVPGEGGEVGGELALIGLVERLESLQRRAVPTAEECHVLVGRAEPEGVRPLCRVHRRDLLAEQLRQVLVRSPEQR